MVSNAKRGAEFEEKVLEEFETFAPGLVVKRVDRSGNKYESDFDIEIINCPWLAVDCKFTVGNFSFKDLQKLLGICQKKYCTNGGTPVIIYGQRKGKTRITREEIGVALIHRKYGVICIPLRAWLQVLNERVGEQE